MSNNNYQIYIDKTFKLASAIVIKSEETIQMMNKYLTDYFGPSTVDSLRPETWRYYLNVCGNYHDKDTMMSVVSLDTLENIEFTKENLALHLATAKGYAYGTRQYIELVNRYPNQEMLIIGILYPTTLAKALSSDNYTILSYPKDLVESNEYNLINKLQTWLYGYRDRWVNQQYGISDELYHATALGMMYINLVPAILNFRLEACKTNEAHSFHVRQYLGSHGFLDEYLEVMTLKQALFFYRNIAYIERNSGKKYVFDWLIDHIMTERYLPLSEYTMRHDVTDQEVNLYPTLGFQKNKLNDINNLKGRSNVTLQQMLDKEDKLARSNYEVKEDSYEPIKEMMENSLSNVVLTKTLETSVIDYSNTAPYSLEEILFNEWIHLSSSGRYLAIVNVIDPQTGEKIQLNAKDAFIFMWYAFCKTIGIELLHVKIPNVMAKRVQRLIPVPGSTDANPITTNVSIDDMMSVVDKKMVSRDTAELALSMQPSISKIISIEAFHNTCSKIHIAAMMQRNIVASQSHLLKRAMVHDMVSRIYSDNECVFDDNGKTYSQWFTDRSINIVKFTDDNLKSMYISTMQDAVGLTLSTNNTLKELQASMTRLLLQLSSYSIQVVREINNEGILKTDQTNVRVGDMNGSIKAKYFIPEGDVDVLKVSGSMHKHVAYEIDSPGINRETKTTVSTHIHYDIAPPLQEWSYKVKRKVRFELRPVVPKAIKPMVAAPYGIISVIGTEEYLNLSVQQRQDFKDVYGANYYPLSNEEVPVSLNVVPEAYFDKYYCVSNYVAGFVPKPDPTTDQLLITKYYSI